MTEWCEVALTVNGEVVEDRVEPRRLLVDYLRDDCGLTGTKIGCEDGSCGACTVLLDGEPVRSCLMFAAQAKDRVVQTIEGLADAGSLESLQESFRSHHALQCGFCAAGILLTSLELVSGDMAPTEADVREGLRGVVCRCTGYHNIVEAVVAAGSRSSS